MIIMMLLQEIASVIEIVVISILSNFHIYRLEDRVTRQIDGTIEVATVNARVVSKIIVSVMKPKFLVMRLVNV